MVNPRIRAFTHDNLLVRDGSRIHKLHFDIGYERLVDE
jgi:hypothetical protein